MKNRSRSKGTRGSHRGSGRSQAAVAAHVPKRPNRRPRPLGCTGDEGLTGTRGQKVKD